MKKLKPGDRVRWTVDGTPMTGTYVGSAAGNRSARIRQDGSGKIVRVLKRQLLRAHDEILILESPLDLLLPDREGRTLYLAYLQQAHDVRALYERVHHPDEIAHFVRFHSRRTRIVHLSCHGRFEGADTYLELTRERLYFRQDGHTCWKDWFLFLRGKILVLSSCEVGGDAAAMQKLVSDCGLEMLVAYQRPVRDGFAFLSEALLYELLLHRRLPQHHWRSKFDAVGAFLHRHGFDEDDDEDAKGTSPASRRPALRVFLPQLGRVRQELRSALSASKHPRTPRLPRTLDSLQQLGERDAKGLGQARHR